MKKCLFAIVLLSTSQYAAADVTFKFNQQKSNSTQSTYTYQIKAHLLRFSETKSNRKNIFDRQKQQFHRFDPNTGEPSMLNEQLLNIHLTRLNQHREERLAEVENKLGAKIKNMSAIEQQTAESLLNQLKYPDLYGEHTLLKLKPANETRRINNIECSVYQLFKKDTLIRSYCMASALALKIKPQEYRTLREFYAFDYNLQSKMLLAMGKTSFTIIDFEQHSMPGIAIETVSYKNNKKHNHLILQSVNYHSLEDSLFDLNRPR